MKPKSVLAGFAKSLLLLALCGHLALTVLYVTPTNPLRMQYQGLVARTIGRFFNQNWQLFAPDPISSTMDLQVQCLREGEAPSLRNVADPGWENITQPLWTSHQHNPFGAYDRLARPLLHAMQTFMYGDPATGVFAEDCKRGNKSSCERFEAELKLSRTVTSAFLARAASAYCRDIEPAAQIQSVAIRIQERGAVPWSERNGGTQKSILVDVGVHQFDSTVIGPGLYSKGNKS